MRLIFIGDSIVAGTGDPECRGWAGRVGAASVRAGVELTAYNLGIGGDTSAGVLARWRDEVGRRVNPDIDNRLVAQFGVNDARDTVDWPVERTVANLGRFLDETAAAGFAPLIVGPIPTAQPHESERIGGLSRLMAAVCAERGAGFVELHAGLRDSRALLDELRHGDGYHPGSDGYSEIARAVLENGWWEWLARASATRGSLGQV
jgi:lysophospholipase L1-like esterase